MLAEDDLFLCLRKNIAEEGKHMVLRVEVDRGKVVVVVGFEADG